MDGPSASFHGIAVLASLAAWTAVFGIVNLLQPKRSRKWNARVVASIHGATVSVMSLVFGIWCNPSPFTDPGGVSNFYEVLIQVTCLGFFVFDTISCFMINVYGHETSIMAVHHVICMIGMMTSLSTGVSGTEISVAIGLGECTNPMFHLRWFMRELGVKKYDFWYQVNDGIFVVLIFIARGVIWPYLVYCGISHPRPAVIVKYLSLSFSFVNIFLLVGITEFVYRKYVAVALGWKQCGRRRPVRSEHAETKCEDSFEGVTMHKTLGDVLSQVMTRWKMKP